MIDKTTFIEEIAQKICVELPEGVAELKVDTQKNIKATLQSVFERMHLVTREEFDVQRKILERTKAEVEQLEQQTQLLEIKLRETK